MRKKAEKRCIFRLDLKAYKVLDDVISDGRLFHLFAVVRSPVTQSCVGSTASAEVEGECSHCRSGI